MVKRCAQLYSTAAGSESLLQTGPGCCCCRVRQRSKMRRGYAAGASNAATAVTDRQAATPSAAWKAHSSNQDSSSGPPANQVWHVLQVCGHFRSSVPAGSDLRAALGVAQAKAGIRAACATTLEMQSAAGSANSCVSKTMHKDYEIGFPANLWVSREPWALSGTASVPLLFASSAPAASRQPGRHSPQQHLRAEKYPNPAQPQSNQQNLSAVQSCVSEMPNQWWDSSIAPPRGPGRELTGQQLPAIDILLPKQPSTGGRILFQNTIMLGPPLQHGPTLGQAASDRLLTPHGSLAACRNTAAAAGEIHSLAGGPPSSSGQQLQQFDMSRPVRFHLTPAGHRQPAHAESSGYFTGRSLPQSQLALRPPQNFVAGGVQPGGSSTASALNGPKTGKGAHYGAAVAAMPLPPPQRFSGGGGDARNSFERRSPLQSGPGAPPQLEGGSSGGMKPLAHRAGQVRAQGGTKRAPSALQHQLWRPG